MPRKPLPLPPSLGGEFHVRDAMRAGVGVDRLRGSDLVRPFHGVRTTAAPQDVADLCRACSARMRPHDAFSHVTAAALWRMPLPLTRTTGTVHVTSPVGHRAARGRGVQGHTHPLAPDDLVTVAGLRVTSPAATWLHLSAILPWWDLVAVGDFIVTGLPYESRLPLASLPDLAGVHDRAGASAGAAARRRALLHIREGPFSRPESLSLVIFELSALPRPLVNRSVLDSRGSFIAQPDAMWPDYRVAYEYEGDHHRGVAQYRRDVRRIERLVDEGWLVIKATADDVFGRPAQLAARVGQRLTARGWKGSLRRLPRIGPFDR